MRKITFLIAFSLTISCLNFSSCSDDKGSGGNTRPLPTLGYLSVSPTAISAPANQSTLTMNIKSDNTGWAFSGEPKWISISQTSGNTDADVDMIVSENTRGDKRTAIFYLNSTELKYKYEQPIDITQAGAEPMVIPAKTEFSFGFGMESETINVKSNCDWQPSSSANWLSAERNGDQLTLKTQPNDYDKYREAQVNLVLEGKSYAVIDVTQFPAQISVSDLTLTFENTASKYNITITSETDWNAIASDSWINITPSSGGAGEVIASIEVSPNESVNERTGYVSIRTGNYDRLQIEIKQKGLYLEGDSELSFTARSEIKKVKISSNIEWQAAEEADWIEVNPKKGSGSSEISIGVSANQSTQSRKGTVLISSPTLNISYRISITQAGMGVTPGTTLLEFDDKGGEQQFELTSDGKWTSSITVDWATATPVSGSGDAVIKVKVEPNTTEYDRSGQILYQFGNDEKSVRITQSSKYFKVDASNFNFPSTGGTHTIELGTNQTWTAKVADNATWLTVNPASGDKDVTINVVATANNSVSERTSTIIITPQYSQEIMIPVTQAGRTLKVSASQLSFYAKGGTSESVTVEADGNYTVTTDAAWLSINRSANSFNVTAQPNTQPNRRQAVIKVTLEGITDGNGTIEIPVQQTGEGGSFIIEGYPSQDADWNNASKGGLTIKINGYTTDSNWN